MRSFFSKWMKSEDKPSWEPIFSHLHPPEKFLFLMKMASSEMVCVVKQITGNYRDGDFLFHFSEINITLPFSVTILFK